MAHRDGLMMDIFSSGARGIPRKIGGELSSDPRCVATQLGGPAAVRVQER
jgi:hypothetical protein